MNNAGINTKFTVVEEDGFVNYIYGMSLEFGALYARDFPGDIVMVNRRECHGDGEYHCCCDQLEDCKEE
jgi:hypothetical protein